MRRASFNQSTFRSSSQTQPASNGGNVSTGGTQMEAMRAVEELRPTPPPMSAPGASWSEISRSVEHSKTPEVSVQEKGHGGKYWGELRSEGNDTMAANPGNPPLVPPAKESKSEKEAFDKKEERLEPERTMEGLGESSEESNSLQAFRAVEKRYFLHFEHYSYVNTSN